MNSDQQLVWRRLERLQFDAPGASQSFTIRLAREQGWSLRYAVRVVDEYRRFLFLAATSGPACPSEQVDEAWHLHLCYTRSYWTELCGEVLRQPLHHQPTEGGPAQLEHHRAKYLATLAAYRRQFGKPPADIWPDVDERFAATSKRSIDLQRHIILPRPRLGPLVRRLRQRLQRATWLGAVALTPMIGAAWNPLDLPGPEFLPLIALLLATAIIGAGVLRRLLRAPDDGSPYPELDAYEVAVLAGDEKLAMQTAICEMTVAGQLALDNASGRLRVVEHERPGVVHPLAQAIYDGLANREVAGIGDAYNAGQLEAARIGVKLESLKLLETPQTSMAARWIPGLLCGGVALFGATKIAVGLSRDKPVAFLVVLTIAAIVATAIFLRPMKRSLRGNNLLRKLQREHPHHNQSNDLFTRPPGDVAMGIALFGLAALATGPGGIADLHRWLRPQAAGGTGCTSAGTGCGAGCGGGGGGGGCSSGCGGCGGGD